MPPYITTLACTGNALDWTKRLHSIADHFDIPVRSAIFDGELVVAENNRTNFSELQANLASGRKDRLAYFVFDLLYLEGLICAYYR